jgi:hypothetical protein
MPKELTLNDPLCGAEIKQIAVQKFADALDRDCTLVDDLTYPGFTIDFEARIHYMRSITSGTLVWGKGQAGEVPKDGEPETIKGTYVAVAPNVAREENNLPIPVMVQTPSGPKRQKVRFQKPESYKKAADAKK